MQTHSRRTFITASSVSLVGGVAFASGLTTVDQAETDQYAPVRAAPDRLREFVGACHMQIDKVREMLNIDPDLVKASWDWGFGDCETAIGACSHTGRTDIIELLLEHGARPTIFTLAMLDKIDAIRGFIESMPGAREIEGPHSISLYRHARAGNATRVIEYLENAGLDQGTEIFKTDRSHVNRLTGRFAAEGHNSADFEIGWVERFECLSLKIGQEPARNLIPQGYFGGTPDYSTYLFKPAGSRGAKVQLAGKDILIIRYAGNEIRAKRWV